MDVRSARDLFPALKDKVFLDTGAMGLLPEPARRALRSMVDLACEMGREDTEAVYEALASERTKARAAIAALVGASVEEVALMESTTHGLNVAALSLPLRRGDEVAMPDTEFIQVPIPWARLAEEKGVRLKFFSTKRGSFGVEDVERALGRRARVLALSSVQWSSGFRCDLDAIAKLCRDRGVMTVIDAIQHAGALGLDLRKTPVDLVASGGHKWLNAPLGCGFLYIRKRLLEKLRAPLRGYQGLADPRGGWEHYFHRPSTTPKRAFRFPRKASAFEIGGTANYPGALALRVSAEIANAIGIEVIEAHIRSLVERFLEGLDRQGLRVVSSRDPRQLSGIVVFRARKTPAGDLTLTRSLRDRRILVSMRYTSGVGGIRASFHYFNNEDDVERLLEALQKAA